VTRTALLCALTGCTAALFAQTPPAVRVLHGKVVKSLRENVSEAVPNANITLEQTGKSVTSNSAGLFFLPLPQSFLDGEEITINVGAPGYAIFQPVGGHTRIPRQLQKDIVYFELLPLGSPRFFSHEHLVALLKTVAEKSAKDARPADSNRQKLTPDLGRYLEDWAHQYGFGLDQVKAEVDLWANDVEKKQDNIYELGLAAFAKKNFGEAGARFLDSARQNEHKLQETRHREQQLTADTIRDYRLAGDSYSNNYAFAQAAEWYEKALSLADRQTDPQLWASVSVSCGNARQQLGIRAAAADALPNLLKAQSHYRRALEVYTREQLPQDWAATQNNLGFALCDLAERSEGAAGVQALNEAIGAYRRALEVYTENETPFYWVLVMRHLARGYEQHKDWTKAREAYQQLLRRDPQNENYRSKTEELAAKRN
jgi:tetratricopeptide (TPR) repeat protein